jgi:hypothetical protein
MTAKERVYSSLEKAQERVCDDCLVPFAHLSHRQVAHAATTALVREGMIVRSEGYCHYCGKEKIVSRIVESGVPSVPASVAMNSVVPTVDAIEVQSTQRPWYWEGHVQARLVRWLIAQGFAIEAVADTAARTAGKDIIAVTPTGTSLWVSVKGFPEKSRHVQARHWFAGAIFDIVLYRNEATSPQLAVAFPDGFPTYRALVARMTALRAVLPFTIYWVAESGEVRVE